MGSNPTLPARFPGGPGDDIPGGHQGGRLFFFVVICMKEGTVVM